MSINATTMTPSATTGELVTHAHVTRGFLPISLRQMLEHTDDVVFAVSLALNAALITILMTEQNSILKSYSRVLLQSCFSDIFYSVAMVTAKLKAEFYNGQVVILIDGVYRNMPREWHFFGVAFYVFSLYLSMFVMPIVFYFRYSLVVKNKLLSSRRLWQIFAGVSAFSTLPALCIVTAYLRMEPNRAEKCATVFSDPMWTYGDAPVHNCFITNADNPMLLMYYAVLGFGNVAMYAVMIFCTKATFHVLRSARPNMHDKTARLQAQMNMLLIVQLLTPTLFAAMPLTAAVITCVIRFTFSGLALLVLFCFVWIPLINPLITIALVSNYRRKFLQILATPFRYCGLTTFGARPCDSSQHGSATRVHTTESSALAAVQMTL